MKIDFKTLGGEKVDYSDLFVDKYGNVYQLSTEGYLVARTGIKAHPKMSKIDPDSKKENFRW